MFLIGCDDIDFSLKSCMLYRGIASSCYIDFQCKVIRGTTMLDNGDIITYGGSTIEEFISAFKTSVDDYYEFSNQTNG